MKRRNFLKGIFGASAIVAAGDVLSDPSTRRLAEIIKNTKDVIQRNVRPHNPEQATKYISSLYRSEKAMARLDGELFTVSIEPATPKSSIEANNYFIFGTGKSKNEAWGNFWLDFDLQTQVFGNDEKDIYWRRVVSELSDNELDTMTENWEVQCRFSVA